MILTSGSAGIRYRAYFVRAIVPSMALESSFKKLARLAQEQGCETVKLPPELIRVFDRMLASDKEIQVKRASDADK